jgi:tetratricopeptide (TPR) repeat protein
MWSGRVDDGIAAYEAALAQRIAYAGADDPEVAQLLSDYAASLLEAGRLAPALAAAERADKIISGVADPSDDRIDPIRVNLAAVLIGANHDDEALGLLETARTHSVVQLGETSTVVANIDSNLAMIYSGKGDYGRAIRSLEAALATDQKLLGPDHPELAGVLYNLAAAHRGQHDYAAALGFAQQAAAIYAAKGPGSDRHRNALTMAALAANDARDFARALALTDTALGFTAPPESGDTLAWTQLERARALIGVGRANEARSLLRSARTGYLRLNMTQRVEQIDELVAQLPK